jgi:hypothetical protein
MGTSSYHTMGSLLCKSHEEKSGFGVEFGVGVFCNVAKAATLVWPEVIITMPWKAFSAKFMEKNPGLVLSGQLRSSAM